MGHASKGFLSCDRLIPPIANYLPFGNPDVSHVATGPIGLRREPNPHYAERRILPLEDEAMLRIRCWRGGSVQTTEVQACS